MSNSLRIPLVLLCLAIAWAWPGDARAQIHKCTTPEGQTVYTDQRCANLGATEQVPQATPKALGASGLRLYRGGCSRTLQDLVYEITSAIDAQDANRLSGIYHWVGVGTASAASVMDRLETIAHRPLADIVPVSHVPEADTGVGPGTDDVPRTTVRRPPVALRLEQTLPNGITPARTTLGLRRHFGCWWVTL